MIYSSGYLPYYNPYYGNEASGGIYNYSQPIPVVYGSGYQPTATSQELFSEAMAAFRQNDTNTTLDLINQAVAQSPDDAALHEFRALVLFAKSDYQQAAATIHSVLALGPGWDWATLSSLYTDVAVYTLQLRALEQFVTEHPRDAGGRFLLAYHYLSTGHPDAAARHLEQVTEQIPEDRVAADLLRMAAPFKAGGITGSVQKPTPQPPEATLPADGSIEFARGGTWNASRPDGSTFELSLSPDSKFSWKFIPKGQPPQEFSGTYTIEGNVLALERPDSGSLVGTITSRNEKSFLFKLVGAPPDDPGLVFDK